MHAVLLPAIFYKLNNNKGSMFFQPRHGLHWKRHVFRCSTTCSPVLYALPTRSYSSRKLGCSFCRILYITKPANSWPKGAARWEKFQRRVLLWLADRFCSQGLIECLVWYRVTGECMWGRICVQISNWFMKGSDWYPIEHDLIRRTEPADRNWPYGTMWRRLQ